MTQLEKVHFVKVQEFKIIRFDFILTISFSQNAPFQFESFSILFFKRVFYNDDIRKSLKPFNTHIFTY